MNKLPKKLIENIKRQEKLIKEMNGYNWKNIIKSKLLSTFRLSSSEAEEAISESDNSETGAPFTATFSYKTDPSSVLVWNCNFVFDINRSTYTCLAYDRNKSPIKISGAVDTKNDIQKGIIDSIHNAIAEVVSKDNQLF